MTVLYNPHYKATSIHVLHAIEDAISDISNHADGSSKNSSHEDLFALAEFHRSNTISIFCFIFFNIFNFYL
jgi:hypothetical protein